MTHAALEPGRFVQPGPVGAQTRLARGEQGRYGGASQQVARGEALTGQPSLATGGLIRGFGIPQPGDKGRIGIRSIEDGEKRDGLYIGLGINAGRGKVYSATGKPVGGRPFEPGRRAIADRAAEGVVEPVTTQADPVTFEGRHIDAAARGEGQAPAVVGNAGQNVAFTEGPVGRQGGILDPEMAVAGAYPGLHGGMLNDRQERRIKGGVSERVLFKGGLLQVAHGGHQAAVGAEVVEACIRQRDHRAGQGADIRVPLGGLTPEGRTEGRKEIVHRGALTREPARRGIPSTFLHEQHDGALIEKPNAGVERVDKGLPEGAQRLGRRFLDKAVQRFGRAGGTEHDAVVTGLLGRGLEAEDDDVGLGKRGQPVVVLDENITAGQHNAVVLGGVTHERFVGADLQVEQVVIGLLVGTAGGGGDGRERLARGGIARQAAALPAAVNDEFARIGQPLIERDLRALGLPGGGQEMGRAAA